MKLTRLIAAAACVTAVAGASAAPAGAAEYKSCQMRDRMFHCVGASGGSLVVKCPTGYEISPAIAWSGADANDDGLVCQGGAGWTDDTPVGSLAI